MLDTLRVIETPEGVHILLRLAGPVPRALAWLLDLLLRIAIYALLGMMFGWMGSFGIWLFLTLSFFLEWFYPVLFEVYADGATPGKRAFGLTVLHDDGVPVGWSGSMVRNLLRAVDFLPFLYAFGLCALLLNRDFKRLGDLVARTVVVYREKPKKAPQLPPGQPLPLPVRLSSTEQQLIVSFAARIPRMTPERAEELAQILGPALVPADNRRERAQGNVPALIGYARHLLGER
ncbi:MAG: RDD family protein [Betaproteobacteria bacterium]|nr:RDD family protein [Betaproteobacteria bacterium]